MADYLRIPRHNISVSLLRSLVSLAVLALQLLIASPATHAQDAPTSDPVLSAALTISAGSAIQQATLAQTQAGQVQAESRRTSPHTRDRRIRRASANRGRSSCSCA